ncbi:hypothetical protein FBU30_005495 [Linnemannia zychae]|nr:hypothetical protein FBU30_005495 [Linnemannia zychae]
MVDIPKELFADTTGRNEVSPTCDRTRACWQIIRNNPHLENLWISASDPVTNSQDILSPNAEAFLMDTLLRLPKLRRLRFSSEAVNIFPDTTLQKVENAASSGLEHAAKKQRDMIVHQSIERLAAMNVVDLAQMKVCFPKVKSVAPFYNIDDFDAVLSILTMLPGLERLHILHIGNEQHQGNDNINSNNPNKHTRQEIDKQLRTIIVQKQHWHPINWTRLVSWSPHLVTLEICSISPETIATIAQTCNNLQYLQFNVMQRCSKEINKILVKCSRLKSLRGRGLAIYIEDIIQGPRWTCYGLETFQCGIMGVPWLTFDEEMLLRSVQPQFQELRHLDVGFLKLPCRRRHKRIVHTIDKLEYRMSNAPLPDSLELSMASGLAHLATLQHLEALGFQVDQRIGEEELQWMRDKWCLKRMVGFGGLVIAGEQIDQEVNRVLP